MIEIYFDNVLIDNDYYADITNDFKLFDEEFMLGTTSSNAFNIEIPYSAINKIPNEVTIKINNRLYATLIVDDYKIKDNNILSLALTDKMVNFEFSYDASSIVPCTISDILSDICNKANVELGTTEFINSDVEVNYYDNTITAREYIGYIAELNGGYAVIGQDGKLYLKKFVSSNIEVDVNDCEDFKIGEHHKIERVVFDNGLLKFESSSDESKETLYLNSDNVYITNEEIFNNIVNVILNFEFYCFQTGNCPINEKILAGDVISFIDGNKIYKTIAQYSLSYYGTWIGGYSLTVNSKRQQETQNDGLEKKVKSIKVRLNRDENELDILVEKTDKNTSDISNLDIKSDVIQSSVSGIEETNNDLSSQINIVKDTLTTINESILTQTKNQFEMLFKESNFQGTLDELQSVVNNQNATLDELQNYIRFGTTIYEGETTPYVELGSSDSETKLMIIKNRIRFMSGNNESAYLSNNTLYITDSTILSKIKIGHWLTYEDDAYNLNTKWVSD